MVVAVDVVSAVAEAAQIVAASRAGNQTVAPAGGVVRTAAVAVEVAQIAGWSLGVGYKRPVHRKWVVVADGQRAGSSLLGLRGHRGQSCR